MTATDVATLVGSLRRGSINRRLAESLTGFAPAELSPSIVEIRQLPLYDQDLDDSPPLEWNAFRQRIKAADAVLFVTPEYNRSVPGALKNALDVGPMARASGAASPAPSSAPRLARSELSARTTIFASASSISTCPQWLSRKRI
jgi:chromate reductase